MTIKRKQTKSTYVQMDAEEVINRGGKTVAESSIALEEKEESEIRFTLRITQDLIDGIDKERKSEVGKVSRNQWILKAIADKLSQ